MANITVSPNMNLPIPVPGQDPGPDWANNIVACLNAIDSHNHSPNQGVQVQPDGISITADLPYNDNNATALRSVRFNAQTAPLAGASDIGCLYESGVDLYYNDGNGNQVRITQSGSVTGATGTITGLPSGTASASFSNPTFTFESATSTPAVISAGPYTMGRNAAGSNVINFSPSSSQIVDYNFVYPPALPSSNSFLSINNVGNASFVALGSTVFGPANKNTNGFLSLPSATAFNLQFLDIPAAGIYLITAQVQLKMGDNSTNPSTDLDFTVSSANNNITGLIGGFACIDFNSIEGQNATSGLGNYTRSGSLMFTYQAVAAIRLYLNCQITFTGTAPKARGGFQAALIGA